MWRWRTLVRQLCVGPRAHGLIGTYQVSPQTIYFLRHVVIIILLLGTHIFNRFCLNTIVCFNTKTINKANIFQNTVFLLPAFTRHSTKFTKYWTLLHASWLTLNVLTVNGKKYIIKRYDNKQLIKRLTLIYIIINSMKQFEKFWSKIINENIWMNVTYKITPASCALIHTDAFPTRFFDRVDPKWAEGSLCHVTLVHRESPGGYSLKSGINCPFRPGPRCNVEINKCHIM